jgi:hypothetical protein
VVVVGTSLFGTAPIILALATFDGRLPASFLLVLVKFDDRLGSAHLVSRKGKGSALSINAARYFSTRFSIEMVLSLFGKRLRSKI